MEAFKLVKANRGTGGVDEVSLEAFEEKLKDNLYKIWNRLSSGSYFPPAVKGVEIPKKDEGGVLPDTEIKKFKRRYRRILKMGEKECPLVSKVNGKKGRQKQSKSRNLLTRLRDYEDDI